MERLTNEEVRVDESMDRYLGPRSALEGMKPKLLDLFLTREEAEKALEAMK